LQSAALETRFAGAVRRTPGGSPSLIVERVNANDDFSDLQARDFPKLALSAYLPAGGAAEGDARYHAAALRSLAREARARLGSAEEAALARELPEAVAHLEQTAPPAGRALALFSCGPAGLLRTFSLPEPVERELRVGPRLHLAPIRRQLAHHPPALVIVADKEKVEVFSALFDEVEELATLAGEEVKRHRQGGPSALAWQRREDQAAQRNLKAAVGSLERLRPGTAERLYVAGPPEARAELEELLRRSGRHVTGELRLPLYLSPGETRRRIRDLLREVS
jgi:hypothetical protein